MCLTLRSLVSRLVPLCFGWNSLFPTLIRNIGFKLLQNRHLGSVFIPRKRGTNLKTHLLEFKHMLRLKVFYLGLPNSVLKPVFSNMHALHIKTHVSIGSWKWMVLTQKRGTNLKTKLFKVRHMSRSKSFYLGSLISISKPVFANVWPPC